MRSIISIQPTLKFASGKALFDKSDSYSIRGICMILIIIHHLFQFSVSKYSLTYVMPLPTIFQSFGYLSTSVFFLLSGYGLYLSLKRNEPISTNYIVSHISKLYIPFLFVWLMDFVICLYRGDYNVNDIGSSLITIGLCGGGNSLWFLKEIFVIYIVAIFSFLIMKLDIQRLTTIIALTLAFVTVAVYFDLLSMWWNSVLCFPIGMFCAIKRDKIQTMLGERIIIAMIILFIISFAITIVSKSLIFPKIIIAFSMIISSIAFSICVICLVRFCNIQNKFLDWIGKNSLIFYLSHIFLLVNLLSIGFFAIYAIVVVLGTFFISWLYANSYRKLSVINNKV